MNQRDFVIVPANVEGLRRKMYICDICGYKTERRFNYLRHKKTHEDDDDNASEQSEDDSEQYFADSEGGSEHSFTDSEESDEADETSQRDVWDAVMERTFESLDEEFDSLVDRYLMKGEEREKAELLAKETLLPKYRDKAIEHYLGILSWQTRMSKDPIHKKMKATAKRLREEDYEPLEAWQYYLEKRKFLLDKKIKLFQPAENDDSH